MTSETRVTHTPGPWAHGFDSLNATWNVMDADARMYTTVKPRGNQNPAEIEANARLIASAPDLLAALEALTQLGTDDNGAIIVGPRGWELAQAAIRRARGED